MSKVPQKVRAKTGFRRLSFDEAYSVALDQLDALAELRKPLSKDARMSARKKLRSINNRITPAARQSSAAFESAVLSEAMAWIRRHGDMRNIGDFIRHFQSLACAKRVRWKSGSATPATDDAVRKILRNFGIRGRPGRPRGS